MTATQIEWTDATWNPTTGCTKISPGCQNCYAERIAERLRDSFDYSGVSFQLEIRIGVVVSSLGVSPVLTVALGSIKRSSAPDAEDGWWGTPRGTTYI